MLWLAATVGCAVVPMPVVVESGTGCVVHPVVGPLAVRLRNGSCVEAVGPKADGGVRIEATDGRITTLTAGNSPLGSGKIRDLVVDARDGVWIVYRGARMGTARLSGTVLEPFGESNAPLPTSTVEFVYAEPPEQGPPGDAVWVVTGDGLTRCDLDGMHWKHLGRAHSEAADAMRFLGADGLLTDRIVGVTALATGGGLLWIATPSRIHAWDGAVFTRLPDDLVRGVTNLRYDRVVWAGGCVWVTLRHRDSRRIEGVVRWRPGAAAWEWLGLEASGVVPSERIALSACGGLAWLTSPGWRDRAYSAGPDDAGWKPAEPASSAPGGLRDGAIE